MKNSRLALLALPLLAAACNPAGNPDNNNATTQNATPPADITNVVEDRDAMPEAINSAETAAAAASMTKWAGRWNGPEGLFLDIAPAKDGMAGHFALTIKDTLDSEGSYMGTAQGDAIAFERNGKAETIRSGTGPETGFKYLLDKKNCLIVQTGKEGYCR